MHSEKRKIVVTVGTQRLTAVLDDSETSKDFILLLPLALEMIDLFGREKYASLPKSLSQKGKLIKSFEVGDIAYWALDGHVAIFYRQDGAHIDDSLYLLGKIQNGNQILNAPGTVEVRMEIV